MIGLLQRVKNASVTVNDQVIGAVEKGLLILVCAEKGDSAEQCEKLAKKVLAYRIFEDENGKMNKSVSDIGGEILIVLTLLKGFARALRLQRILKRESVFMNTLLKKLKKAV